MNTCDVQIWPNKCNSYPIVLSIDDIAHISFLWILQMCYTCGPYFMQSVMQMHKIMDFGGKSRGWSLFSSAPKTSWLNPKSASIHWLTPENCVHLFRNFLPTMRTPLQMFPSHTNMTHNRNACRHEEETIGMVGRKFLNRCMPFSGVSQWINEH